MKDQLTQHQRNWRLWIEAARPKTLTAAIVPMIVGTCLATRYTQNVSWLLTLCAVVSAMMIQIGTNLINDALDFKNGCDTKKRLGPRRVTASGWFESQEVLNLGIFCLMTAVLIGMPLILVGGFPLALVIGTSALLGYLYTGGPKPLAYQGLGDLFVFLFFGVVATASIVYVQTGFFVPQSLIAGSQIGLSATVLIAINNLRDRAEDATTGKRTFAVRYGTHAAKLEILGLLFGPYVVGVLWGSALSLLPLTTLPLSTFIAWKIWTTEPSELYNLYLAQSSLYHLMIGITLAAGLVIL